ncbi:MAG: protein kinase [Pseudomonadota bacterium]
MAGPQYTHFGRYRIVEELASGGMATVYKAVLTGASGFEKIVALKVMHAHLGKDEHHRRMFEDEARTGALLRHRAIIETLDYGQEQNLPFLATEFLDGQTLAEAMKKRKKLPPELVAWILSELLDALAYAHALEDAEGNPLGIVHRDVSPQNIFLGRDGRVTLIDFGIALREGRMEQTRTGLVKGKFRYMAPEQASGRPLEGRADIYSLALVTVGALTGVKPFLDAVDTREQILQAQGGFTPPGALLTRLPPPFADLLRRMLAKGVEARPAAPVALEEMEAILGNEYPEAGPRALAEWLHGPRKRTRPAPTKSVGDAKGGPGRTQGPKPAKAGTPGQRATARKKAPPPRRPTSVQPPREPGLTPAWIFGGLAALFFLAIAWTMLGGGG